MPPPLPPNHEHWMREAVAHARRGIAASQSPFGAVIVRGDTLIAAAHNEVWLRSDPTAHAEVLAIRRAAAALASIDLSGCHIYTTCEPCPMCAAAIHWAKLDAVSFGAAIDDARRAGFSELTLPARDLYHQTGSPVRITPPILPEPCAQLFAEWAANPAARPY